MKALCIVKNTILIHRHKEWFLKWEHCLLASSGSRHWNGIRIAKGLLGRNTSEKKRVGWGLVRSCHHFVMLTWSSCYQPDRDLGTKVGESSLVVFHHFSGVGYGFPEWSMSLIEKLRQTLMKITPGGCQLIIHLASGQCVVCWKVICGALGMITVIH